MQQPDLHRKRGLSPIWILPLVALCIGAWLLYTSYRDAGIEITVHFASAEGITAGKTRVIYRGIPVGLVKKVEINQDLDGVDLIIEMKKETRKGLVQDTQFWIVRPEISAGRISGLETLFSGAYIGVRKGKSTVPATTFEGLPEPPPLVEDRPGLRITLIADSLYSLQKGSYVYARNLQIGHVENYRLNENNKIVLSLYIRKEFSHLIRQGTRFWNASGLSINGDLQRGLTVNIESLASLIYGGITCATPPALADSPPAEQNQQFTLYKDFEAAEYGIPMTLQLASGEGIVPGKTRIMFRGLKAGVVKELNINRDKFHTVTATVLLDPRAKVILRKGTRFWVVRPRFSVDGIRNLSTLITGPYITFEVGDGPFQDHFVVQQNPLPRPTLREGTRFTLTARDSGSLEPGAPVLYRKMPVGEITNIALTPDGKAVQTTILIYQPYVHLVHRDSVFWNVSGVRIHATLPEVEISLSSVRSLLVGGIAFLSPATAGKKQAKPAAAGTGFTLYSSYYKAVDSVPALQPAGMLVRLRAEKMPVLGIAAPVYYNNIKVGEVRGFRLARNRRDGMIDVFITEKYRDLVNTTTRFYNFSGFTLDASLQQFRLASGPLKTLLLGGISFITPGEGKKPGRKQIFTLYEDLEAARNADAVRLTLHLNSGAGIVGGTKIKYQGIVIGKITRVWFDNDLEHVLAEARVKKKTARLFTDHSILWLVEPQLGLSGAKHLETILTGPYITLSPGPGEPVTELTVQARANDVTPAAGLNLVLETPRLGSLRRGSPVYYRQIPVGRVRDFALAPDGRKVLVHVHIEAGYDRLVYTGTKFWNVSGVEISAGLFSGLNIDTESMEALLTGGIAFATPEGKKMGRPARDNDHFVLYARARDRWREWQPELPWRQAAGAGTGEPREGR